MITSHVDTGLFREALSRPSKDLFVALGTLILRQLPDLADLQMTEALALNIVRHFAHSPVTH